MKLWLDDMFPPTFSSTHPNDADWVWAKNFSEFESLIQLNEKDIKLISYDNDLGDTIHHKEGKHCFSFMEEMLFNDQLKNLKDVILHSDNASAVSVMMTAKDSLQQRFGITLKKVRRNTSHQSTQKNTNKKLLNLDNIYDQFCIQPYS
jgi:hypothetical protein